MAMTATVKDELSRVAVSKVSARKAEVSALVVFDVGVHFVAGRVIVVAEVDSGAVA
jgi:DNA-binding transcriptional regulator WhiA